VAELLRFPPSPAAAPPDAEARRAALDICRSFIVEAPAGSGKTGLLIQRLLKLLADDSVEQPEQVLAMTFTIKATGEMRDRVLAHLIAAAQSNAAELAVLDQLAAASSEPPPAENSFQAETRALALAVLARDRQLGWALLDHPHRLNIRTIGSVCADIAGHLPVLSGSGGRLSPTTDPGPLYREAARRTLLLLGTGDAIFDEALRNLLLHRDGNLAECETLLAGMLHLRDQWARLVPLTPSELDDKSLDSSVRPRLELALDHAIRAALTPLVQAFPAKLLAELAALAADLSQAAPYDPEVPSPIALCAGLHTPPEAIAAHLDHWLSLLHLLTMSNGELRKERGITSRNLRFDYNRKHSNHTRFVDLLEALRDRDDLLRAFQTIRALPSAHYPDEQWVVAKSLFRILSRALVELQLVFSEHGECDFTEPTLLARTALTAESGPDDLASALGAGLQHLLVDEMQDTSTSQYEIIELLTQNWDGYSQTVFLVGDPKQSIYLFRQAHVERFVHTMQTQRLGDLPLTRLLLTANFRSQSNLVDQFNQDFSLIFATAVNNADSLADTSPLDIPHAPAEATRDRSSYAQGVVWHAHPVPSATASATPSVTIAKGRRHQHQQDAMAIRSIAMQWLDKPLAENRRRFADGQPEPWRIAVLVRNRAHLDEIVAALKSTEVPGASAIPFRAIEIDALNERQEVLDLTALTRALLHPADRVAALAVLRAPWCGLSLADLHTLTGTDDPDLKDHSILRLMDERGHLLPDDSCKRLQRVWQVLAEAAVQRARLTPAQLVERAWRSLGGDAWLPPPELTNADRFLKLLDEIEDPGGRMDLKLLDRNLTKLFAEPSHFPESTGFVDLMTIHKAKGLEWDVVIVPALEGKPGGDRSNLLTWAEIDSDATGNLPDGRAAHIMLAPISGKGVESHALNRWLKNLHRAREAAERKRLFYVACTRAREELHLFASPQLTSSGEIHPRYDSLLQAAWPAAEAHFFPTQLPEIASVPEASAEPFVLDLAAAAFPSHPTLQRLPLAFDPAARFAEPRAHRLPYGDPDGATASSQAPFSRPEGSFAARSFGNVVHAALETLANRIAAGSSPAALLAELPAWTPRLAALLRADGLPHATINRLARDARTALENTLRDPDGLWLLALNSCAASEFALTAWPAPAPEPEPEAQSECASLTSASASIRPVSIRIDRIFRSGPKPHSPGEDFLWIVDYKTSAHGPAGLDDFLAAQRATYAPQLETYARILTQLPHPVDRPAPKDIRLALYYPTLPRLLWWPLAAPPA
jgi:ATP-dependent exoDNAse (exonuclease V) beta subunit